MQLLINDLLSFSRHSTSSDFKETDLNILMKEAPGSWKSRSRIPMPRYIYPNAGNPGILSLMRQLFYNLLSNAISSGKTVGPIVHINTNRPRERF
jgi:signal transduction histidine kinase